MIRDAVVSARVPSDLRADLETLARRRGEADLSLTIRRALREHVERHLNGTTRPNLLTGGQGAARRNGTHTERAAALKVAGRVGSQRRRALELYASAGNRGLTADEVCELLAPLPVNGVARRVTDLLQGQAVVERIAPPKIGEREAKTPEGVLTRRTRAGAQATVYVITPHGRRLLEDAADRERARSSAS